VLAGTAYKVLAGTAYKVLAGTAYKVLAGTAYDRRVAVYAGDYSSSALYDSSATDDTTYRNAYYAQGARYTAWESALSSYSIGGSEFITFHDARSTGRRCTASS
jgi:hypothetical protein